LWFANDSVVQMVDPARLAGNGVPPVVHLEAIVADRQRHPVRDKIRIPPLTRDLEIDYTALSFAAPQKVRFRYKLEGRDVDWQHPGARRQAFYTDLPPGGYTFRVIASNQDGEWNDQGATLAFTVAPAWYQTWTVRTLAVLSLIAAGWMLYRMRVRQIARAIANGFDERLAERTRIARELHDTLLQSVAGSKMIADDGLKHADDAARMRNALELVTVWLDQAVKEGRAALTALRGAGVSTGDLAEAFRRAVESEIKPASLALTVSVAGTPRAMHPLIRDEIYRIGYEAIHNACLHAKASHLEVELRYEQNLTLRIADNGIGMTPELVTNGRSGHYGLQGMNERAVRIGATLKLASREGAGTQLTLLVPGSVAFQKPPSPQTPLPDWRGA
jgi:signal transduction histidine kinase